MRPGSWRRLAALLVAIPCASGLQPPNAEDVETPEPMRQRTGDRDPAALAEAETVARTETSNCLSGTDPSQPAFLSPVPAGARGFPGLAPAAWSQDPAAVRNFTELVQPAEPSVKPKLTVLMLVNDLVDNALVWEAWMREAQRKDLEMNMLIHTSSGEVRERPLPSVVVNTTFPTRHCDAYLAVLYMLIEGLKDQSVTHLALVSQNSVPVASLATIYSELERDKSSRLCIDPNWPMPRAETWWVLRRSDAMLFLENQELVLGTFRNKNGCADETGWLYPLLIRYLAGSGPAPRNQCTTFADWSGSCKFWRTKTQGMDYLGGECCMQLATLRSQAHEGANAGHPRTYKQVDRRAWDELRRTPFWFGRKFAAGAFQSMAPPYGFE